MEKGIRDSLCYLYDNSSFSYTQLEIATRKNESKMSEAKGGRSKAAAVEKVEDNSELAASTKQVAYLMATLEVPQVIREIKRDRKQRDGSGNKRPPKKRNGANRNNGSNGKQN